MPRAVQDGVRDQVVQRPGIGRRQAPGLGGVGGRPIPEVPHLGPLPPRGGRGRGRRRLRSRRPGTTARRPVRRRRGRTVLLARRRPGTTLRHLVRRSRGHAVLLAQIPAGRGRRGRAGTSLRRPVRGRRGRAVLRGRLVRQDGRHGHVPQPVPGPPRLPRVTRRRRRRRPRIRARDTLPPRPRQQRIGPHRDGGFRRPGGRGPERRGDRSPRRGRQGGRRVEAALQGVPRVRGRDRVGVLVQLLPPVVVRALLTHAAILGPPPGRKTRNTRKGVHPAAARWPLFVPRVRPVGCRTSARPPG